MSSGTRPSYSRFHRYEPAIRIDGAHSLEPEGRAIKFHLPHPPNGDEHDEAFVLRLADGRLVGFFNRCAHVTVPMDYADGEFLDGTGLIMCRVHGARYDPESGAPVLGPGRGPLTRLLVEEDGDTILIRGWERRLGGIA